MKLEHSELVDLARANLSRRLAGLDQIKNKDETMSKSFAFADVQSGNSPQQIEEWLPQLEWRRRPALYVINANTDQTAQALYTTYESTKIAARKVYNRSKRNDLHPLTRCLYVGSSIGNVSARLKQHVHQSANPGTYALQLHKWTSECNFLPESYLEVVLWTFDDQSGLGLLQDIEDCLWQELKPMFGKCGAR